MRGGMAKERQERYWTFEEVHVDLVPSGKERYLEPLIVVYLEIVKMLDS
jgi:hypothetical protein